MANTTNPLLAAADNFAQDIATLLDDTVASDVPIAALRVGGRLLVAPFDDAGNQVPVALQIANETRGELRVTYRCDWDSAGQYLAVEYSQFAIALASLREPFIRFEYVRGAGSIPDAHIQVHAESGALGYFLALQGSQAVPKVQTIHIPVGGKRFRPSLEDVIEFAIRELGVDAHPGWQDAVHHSRARWRRLQLAAAIRDDPETATAVLEELRGR